MKKIWIIILALFTLSSCKFSFDKAKVEESYGSFDDGGGYDGGSGGGGGECPSLDPDASYSTLTADVSTVLANGTDNSIDDEDKVTLTYTLLDCNQQPIAGVTPTFDATNTSSLNIPENSNCTVSDLNGLSTCTLSSAYAESKTITTTFPASLSTLSTTVDFTVPPLTLNLSACLSSAYDITPGKIMSTPVIFNSNRPLYSPYVGSSWFTNNETAVFYSSSNFNTVIDWVLVQIYSNEVSPTALTAKSAVLHDDGTITEPGALPGSGLSFNTGLSNDFNDDYKINIIHRNHLAIGLNDPLTRSQTTVDLTSTSTTYKGETGVITEDPYLIKGSLKCLRPGDFNNDFIVDVNDIIHMRAYILSLTSIDPFNTTINLSGYHATDANLNGYSLLYLAPGTETQDANVIRDQIDNFTMSAQFPVWNDGT